MVEMLNKGLTRRFTAHSANLVGPKIWSARVGGSSAQLFAYCDRCRSTINVMSTRVIIITAMVSLLPLKIEILDSTS